jgi:hypothetical protein
MTDTPGCHGTRALRAELRSLRGLLQAAGALALAGMVALALVAAGCSDEGGLAISEGTAAAPFDLGGPSALISWDGTVGPDGSYYVADVDGALAHSVAMSGLSEDADLYVYETAGFALDSQLCFSNNVGTASESCSKTVLLAGPTQLFIQVKLIGLNGTTFQLSISE